MRASTTHLKRFARGRRRLSRVRSLCARWVWFRTRGHAGGSSGVFLRAVRRVVGRGLLLLPRLLDLGPDAGVRVQAAGAGLPSQELSRVRACCSLVGGACRPACRAVPRGGRPEAKPERVQKHCPQSDTLHDVLRWLVTNGWISLRCLLCATGTPAVTWRGCPRNGRPSLATCVWAGVRDVPWALASVSRRRQRPRLRQSPTDHPTSRPTSPVVAPPCCSLSLH